MKTLIKDEQKLSDLISKLNDLDSRLYDVECSLEEKLDLCEVDDIIIGLVKEEIDAIDFKITVER